MIEDLMLLALFLIFLVLARKALGLFFNALLIALLGASFPFLMNFVGIHRVEITVGNVVLFSLCALLLYLTYIYLRSLFKLSKSISRILFRREKRRDANLL